MGLLPPAVCLPPWEWPVWVGLRAWCAYSDLALFICRLVPQRPSLTGTWDALGSVNLALPGVALCPACEPQVSSRRSLETDGGGGVLLHIRLVLQGPDRGASGHVPISGSRV